MSSCINKFSLLSIRSLLFYLLVMITSSVSAADYDTDGIDDSVDKCIQFYDPLQEDTDGDGIGDACDTDSYEPIITTIAGNGVEGFSGDGGFATQANLNNPYGVTVDSAGDLFIADHLNHRIRKVTSYGIVTTVAGAGAFAPIGDGVDATQARVRTPVGVAVDSTGNLYITDPNTHRIRKVARDGIITTVAGTGAIGFSGDGGDSTLAQLSGPWGVAIDAEGNLYIADTNNHRIRKVSSDGIIATVAGTGAIGFSGDGGDATQAQLYSPSGVAVDTAGNIYIADQGNHRIRKVASDGKISTVAGTGAAGFNGDGGDATRAQLSYPVSVTVDAAGNVYIADTSNLRIRKVASDGTISTLAGKGIQAFSGDGGDATQAGLDPYSVAVDSAAGNVYIADRVNNRIRKVEFDFNAPAYPADTDEDYIADIADNCVNTVNTEQKNTDKENALATKIPGDDLGDACDLDDDNDGLTDIEEATLKTNPLLADTDGDGLSDADETKLQTNPSLKTDPLLADTDGDGLNDKLEIDMGTDPLSDADFDGDTIRDALDSCSKFYDPLDVDTDGDGIGDACDTKNKFTQVINTISGTGSNGFSGDGGDATLAKLFSPIGVVVGSQGDVFIADTLNHRIRKVAPDGTISTVVGTGVAGFSGDGGNATLAMLDRPLGIAIDSQDNLFIADFTNYRIRKVSPEGTISTVVGTGVASFGGDGGDAVLAGLRPPSRVNIDSAGNLFISTGDRIRKVATDGIISTVAGTGLQGFSGDGDDATLARFNSPNGVTVDSAGNLFIADTLNHRIRKVVPDGTISTVAGTGVQGFSGDGGAAVLAQLHNPNGVTTDNAGNLFIADTLNNRIRKIGIDGIISTVAGDGVEGFSGDGEHPISAHLNKPQDITFDIYGNLLVSDWNNSRIRKISWIAATLKDTDSDFVADFLDNCVNTVNLDQLDTDLDGQGNACDADDDNDGLTDEQEALYGTNPLVDADFDGDGLSDADEVLIYNTLPNNADSDSDGMSDDWEITNRLDPRSSADALQDADADGYWNLAEYLEGSSPQNDQSVPASLYVNVVGLGNSALELLVDGLPVSITQNGVQLVGNVPANQGTYNVSISSQPADKICVLANHLNANENTQATNAVDIQCGIRKLGMEPFGFGYARIDPANPTEEISSVLNFVVKVRDENTNQAILGLRSDDFQVKENGGLVSPAESFLESRPIGKLPYTYKLSILLDISRSLLLTDVDLAKQAALSVVNLASGTNGQLKDNTEIAIWTFDGDVTKLQDYTADVQTLTTAISGITRGGSSTNLNEALLEGMASWTDSYLLTDLEFGSLIVITDGSDTAGAFTTQDVVDARGNKAVYAIAVGPEASQIANVSALKAITGEPNAATGEQQRVFTTASFQDLSAQLNNVVKQSSRFFEGLYAIYYTSPKRANEHSAELSLTNNTSCVVMGDLVCQITESFDATNFGDQDPELFAIWPTQFLSTSTLDLQIETFWSIDPANYSWTIISADTGMSLTVDANDTSKVTLSADPTLDDAAITFDVVNTNYPSSPALRYTVLATDGVLRTSDNCINMFNPGQIDTDGDGIGDVCQAQTGDVDSDGIFDRNDNCLNLANSAQTDSDKDGFGDVCDATPNGPLVDNDGDNLIDGLDNCPSVANPDQIDSDSDGQGNACDVTPNGPIIDSDGDGLIDGLDNCPGISNANQLDSDGDGIGNVCDITPFGNIADKDADGVEDVLDNCPEIANARQLDADKDGIGDACVSSGGQALDVDGNNEVNTFDLLMVQRHLGGVSAIGTNILLPKNVGGAGANGEMTREELQLRADQLLKNHSLDVDGNEQTNAFDLLMIQRYIGGVQNIGLNLLPVENVGGSGPNGARTSEEIKQAVAARLSTKNGGNVLKRSALIISSDRTSDVAAIFIAADGTGMIFYQKTIDDQLTIDFAVVVYPDGQEGRFYFYDDGTGCYEDSNNTCSQNVAAVFKSIQKVVIRTLVSISSSFIATANAAPIDLNDQVTGLEAAQDAILRIIQDQLGSLGDRLPFLQNITKQLDEELEKHKNFSSSDVKLSLTQIIQDSLRAKYKGLLESVKALFSFNSVDYEYLDGLSADSVLDVQTVNIETFKGDNYSVEEYKQTIDTSFKLIDLSCSEDSFNYTRKECSQYACGDFGFSSTHAECPNYGEPEPQTSLTCIKSFRDSERVLSLEEIKCVVDAQTCTSLGGEPFEEAQESPQACAASCQRNADYLNLSFVSSESDGSNAKYQRARCLDNGLNFTQALTVDALTPEEACKMGNNQACEDAGLMNCGIQFQSSSSYVEGCLDSNDNKVGIWNSYYGEPSNSKLYQTTEYKEGLPHGVHRKYHDGNLVHEGQFVNGLRNGTWKDYDYIDSEGLLTGTYNYADGATNGEAVCYTYQGKELYTQLTVNYSSGLRNGIATNETFLGTRAGSISLTDFDMEIVVRSLDTICYDGDCPERNWIAGYNFTQEAIDNIRSRALNVDRIAASSTNWDSACRN